MPDSASSPSLASLFNTDALFNNPIFAGGIGIAGLGVAASVARRGGIRVLHLIRRRLLVKIDINKTDPAFSTILAWLSVPREQSGFIAQKFFRIHDLAVRTTNTKNGTSYILTPGYGKHILRHADAYIMVDRYRQSTANMNTGEPFETITLTTLYAHRHVFQNVFEEADALSRQSMEGRTPVYKISSFDWQQVGQPRRKRPMATVILDEGIKEKIVNDVKDFMSRQQWYDDRAIPYRRGYLLYGPPGSGKTSFIQALAGELDYGVASINLSERGLTDDRLALMLTKLPERTLLLLEDADAAFQNRQQTQADGYNGSTVTFSGLLNAMDGVAASTERISFLTTNHVERMDAALIRPGRVDMAVRIGEATRYQAAQMWERFYGDVDTKGVKQKLFLNRLAELGLVSNADGIKLGELRTSTAAIQGLFLFNKDDLDSAIEMAEGLVPQIYEPEPDATTGQQVHRGQHQP